MEVLVDEGLVMEIEARAVEMARGAGRILQGGFGRPLEVEYKDDKKEQDPVTSVDKESQAYLSESIARRFPGHGIVGEEDSREDEAPVPEFLWILDPLDGTTNFLNGLPIYAVSIGVLHRGNPIAGALFIPWSGENDGAVLHARKGGGAWMDEEAISIPGSETIKANRLTGLPASFGAGFRLRKDLRRRVGEVRVTGSIAYELALTALRLPVCGVRRPQDMGRGGRCSNGSRGHCDGQMQEAPPVGAFDVPWSLLGKWPAHHEGGPQLGGSPNRRKRPHCAFCGG